VILTHRRSARRALAATAATAALLTLAGCGGNDSGSEKASDRPAASSSATGDASESAGAGDSSSAAPADGQELTGPEFADLLKGALDQATTAHITMDLGSSVGAGEGDADYTTTPPSLAMKLTMQALGGDVEVRLVDNTMYMKSPTFGDKWVSISLDDPNSPLGALGDSLDVTKQFETFAAAVTTATFTGAEDVDGESLDHYAATVDTAKMLQNLPSQAAGQSDLPATMTQDWWFDSDGYIRQFSSDFGGQTTVMKLSDWGADVTIEAPPSDEVTSMPGMGG
jgi:hypothetical protein